MSEGRLCGTLTCASPAAAVIRHPTHGERTVCEVHIADYEVVRRVE